MSLSSYLSYLVLVTALVFSPGPMTLFLMANGMRSHIKHVFPILLGANHAYLFAIIVFSIGLADLLQKNMLVFKILQVLGIIYLLYLVAIQWKKTSLSLAEAKSDIQYKKRNLYARGSFVALSNPKTVLLFTIVFPQFATQGPDYYWQIFILGITFLALQFSSGCFYAFLGAHINKIVQRPKYQILINKISALVLLLVAIFLMMRLK